MSTLEDTTAGQDAEVKLSDTQTHNLWESGLAPLELNQELQETRIAVGTVTRDRDGSDGPNGYSF